jgi:hypothetical protein
MNIEDELNWRLKQYEELRSISTWPMVLTKDLNERKIFYGGRGVWFDKSRTDQIVQGGIAVGLLHTGRHYPDDISETSILYHYPETENTGRDLSEINSIKNAALYNLPVFVMINEGKFKKVFLAWVESIEDKLGYVLLSFQKLQKPVQINSTWHDPTSQLILKVSRDKVTSDSFRVKRDPKFKFHALQRYEGKCAVTNLGITRILEAAHVVPVEEGGTDDPRNSLLLSPNAHRAFDAGMWAINPKTLAIEESEKYREFQVLKNLKFQKENILDLRFRPAAEALEFRFEMFKKS